MASISRHAFLRNSTGIAAAVAFSPLERVLGAAPLGKPTGLQLYTVKEELAKDFDGTLRRVASIGYEEVEAAGYYDKSAADFRKSIEGAGLTIPAGHYTLQELLQCVEEKIAYSHELGLQYILCSFPFVANPGRFHADKYYQELRIGMTLDDWKWNADQFNRVGEQIKKAGMKFGYHNHNLEFRKLDGVLVYDELLRLTDPNLVTMEMDIGWVARTGHDPAAYLEKYPQRYELLHLKDIKAGPPSLQGEGTASTELGRGSIDWKRVFAAAKRAAVKHFFVEQEDPFADMPVMDAIKVDFDFASRF
jgi:sugar phosphate isomerase/epimerase